MIKFIVGLAIGAIAGVAIMCILFATKDDDYV